MKRLVRDAAKYLIERPVNMARPRNAARAQYEQSLKEWMSAKTVDADLQRAVISMDPSREVLKHYIAVRTRSSYQGSGDLKKLRNTLGIPSARVPDGDLSALDDFFKARNSIVHSMDYTNEDESRSTGRIHRSRDDAATFSNQVFGMACELIHAASEVVVASR